MVSFWLSYMEMTNILMMNIRSLRSQTFDEFLRSMKEMLLWWKINDNDKYSRLSSRSLATLVGLNEEQRAYLMSHFAHSMTGNLYSGLGPMDRMHNEQGFKVDDRLALHSQK